MVKLSESVHELSLCMTTIQIVNGTINTKSILCMISFQIIPLLPLLFSLATFLLLLFKLKLKFNTLFPYLSVFLIKQHCSTSIFYLKQRWELDKVSIFFFHLYSIFHEFVHNKVTCSNMSFITKMKMNRSLQIHEKLISEKPWKKIKIEDKNQDNTKQEFITKIIIIFDSKKHKILQGLWIWWILLGPHKTKSCSSN